jgi:hypothetical protein
MTRPDKIRSTALPQPKMRKVANIWPAPRRAAPRNARTHSAKQLRQIADSIRTFGFTNPVLIDGKGQIIAGHLQAELAAFPQGRNDDQVDSISQFLVWFINHASGRMQLVKISGY